MSIHTLTRWKTFENKAQTAVRCTVPVLLCHALSFVDLHNRYSVFCFVIAVFPTNHNEHHTQQQFTIKRLPENVYKKIGEMRKIKLFIK